MHWLRCVLAEWQLLRARLVRSRLGLWLLLLGGGGVWLATRGAPLTILAPHLAMLGAVLGVAFSVGSDVDRAAVALTLTHPTTPLAVAAGRWLAAVTAGGILMLAVLSVAGALTSLPAALLVRAGGAGLGAAAAAAGCALVVAARGVNAPVLLLSGVTRRRRHRRDAAPVADVSLEVAAGEITALVGPHGSGKTTLLGIAAGLLAPDAGTVTVVGVPAGTPAVRAALGYAPEAPVFPPTLSVREVLGYFARFHAAGTARRGLGAAALERAGLEGAAERRAAGRPLPVARRLALAQAALGPRRILLPHDTPSGV